MDWGMPKEGLFQIFYDIERMPWGFKGDDAGWRFVWYPSFDAARHQSVEGPSCPERARRMLFSPVLTLPDDAGDQLDMYDEESELLPCFEDAEPLHAIGGWPATIQGGPFFNLPPDEGKADTIAEKQELAKRWRLVFQIDSDEDNLGYMWGDAGMIYVGVRVNDLANADLSSPWLSLECY